MARSRPNPNPTKHTHLAVLNATLDTSGAKSEMYTRQILYTLAL